MRSFSSGLSGFPFPPDFRTPVIITRRLEFDAGHRIPDHRSLCKHLHGHRYALEVTVSGDITRMDGDPRNGMVVDFSEVKAVAKECVVDVWDHAFLVYAADKPILDFLQSLPDHRTVVLDVVPTAENLAQKAFDLLADRIGALANKALRLENVRIYETPNCWADAKQKSVA
jgi:6-pyruvoyltetrahydropterin/6-carboxytetrahydropterin synthase